MNRFGIGAAIAALCLFLCLNDGYCEPETGFEPERIPSLLSCIRFEAPISFCDEPVPLDQGDARERLEKEMLLILWDRAQVILWIKRASSFMPVIERMLTEQRMPQDLKYLAVIESALLPHSGSNKGAVGFWQFIRETGLRYDLRIDNEIDERRHILSSTRAAIAYLKKLHGDFNSWALAAAAYNMGEQGLMNAIEEQKVRDYYNLYLPMETQRYVLRAVAVKLIMENPQRYGFDFRPSDLYPSVAFDTVRLRLTTEVPLQIIAEAAGTYYKTIRDLNPQIREKRLSPGEHVVFLPKGSSTQFSKQFPAITARLKPQVRSESYYYVVKNGDSLTGIADRFRIPLSDLLRWNNLNYNSTIHPGQRLVLRK